MKYLYNGIKLPKLPDYDTSVYSDAYIVRLGVQELYSLILLPAGWDYVYNQTDDDSTNYIGTSGVTGKYYNASIESTEWHSPSEAENPVIYSDKLTPVWSNFDIIASDGSVYLSASDPVQVWDSRSFWMGVALGLAGKGLPKMAQPTAYLYNGVKLPALPESELPFAYIHKMPLVDSYELIVTEIASYASKGNGIDVVYTYHGVNRKTFYLSNDKKEWELVDSTPEGSVVGVLDLKWANTDVLFEDGTLYLSASEPIPVYE